MARKRAREAEGPMTRARPWTRMLRVAVCLCWMMAPGFADAAVRVCENHVKSKVTSAVREREAKRAAIKDWTKKAKSTRIPHPSWRIARLKVVTCVPYNGRFDCVAYAAPCTIKQKPPRSPRKRNPKAGGEAVNT